MHQDQDLYQKIIGCRTTEHLGTRPDCLFRLKMNGGNSWLMGEMEDVLHQYGVGW